MRGANRSRSFKWVCGALAAFVAAVGLLAGPAVAQTPPPDSGTPWTPPAGLAFQVQARGEIDPELDVDLLIVPLFFADAETLAPLKARGVRIVCTLHAGVWSSAWPDADAWQPAMLGHGVWGEPTQRWVDVRQSAVRELVAARLDVAVALGCDAIDAYRLDGYLENTGLPITRGDQLVFDRWLAQAAHQRGLGIGLRGAVDFIPELMDLYDFALTEGCLERADCQLMLPFIDRGKPVYHWEFTTASDGGIDICAAAREFGFTTIVKHRELDAWRFAC